MKLHTMWAVVYFSLVLMLGFNFTEHMLFYTSEKYPVEDSYSKYIAEVCLILPGRKFSFSCFVLFMLLTVRSL